MAGESIPYTVANGSPAVPACGGDLPQFAAQLQEWIVNGFSQIDAALAQKERASYDICRDISLLRPGSCMLTKAAIDQREFSYASSGSQDIIPGTGVLPYIGYQSSMLYRAGVQIQPVGELVNYLIRPEIPDNIGLDFGIILGAGNDFNACFSSPEGSRKNDGDADYFGISSCPDDQSQGILVYWLVVGYP